MWSVDIREISLGKVVVRESSNFKFQISTLKSQLRIWSNFKTQSPKLNVKTQTSDIKSKISKFKFQMPNLNLKSQILKLISQISNFKKRVANLKSQTSNLKCCFKISKFKKKGPKKSKTLAKSHKKWLFAMFLAVREAFSYFFWLVWSVLD